MNKTSGRNKSRVPIERITQAILLIRLLSLSGAYTIEADVMKVQSKFNK